MEQQEYEIWTEGYAATGERAYASRILREGETDSKWKAVSFKSACVHMLNEEHWQMLYTGFQGLGSCYYDPENNSYWNCRFFETEAEARESFG